MYASAWIFVSAPIVVSFSTSEPRPTTTSSPTAHPLAHARLVADDHARADRRAREDDRAGRDDRAGAELGGGSGSRFAVERGESVGCLPTTAYSSTLHAVAEHRPRVDDRGRVDLGGHRGRPSARLQPVERPHDREPVVGLAMVAGALLRRGAGSARSSSRSGSSFAIFGL